MKKCIVIPDSFKGTLSAFEICEIEKQAICINSGIESLL